MATPYEMELRHVLRDARRAADLSQTELGRMVGVSQGQVSRWERGDAVPDVFEMRNIALATGRRDLNDLEGLPTHCFAGTAA